MRCIPDATAIILTDEERAELEGLAHSHIRFDDISQGPSKHPLSGGRFWSRVEGRPSRLSVSFEPRSRIIVLPSRLVPDEREIEYCFVTGKE